MPGSCLNQGLMSLYQLPAEPNGVKTIISPNGFDIRYSESGKSGACETTPGVSSYFGYIDIDAETHIFFWFFEARTAPNEALITLWLESGPGSDSLFGLFDRKHATSPKSIYEVFGIMNETTGFPQNSPNTDGHYTGVSPFQTTITSAAAVTVWEVLQAFFQDLPIFNVDVSWRDFSLWTEPRWSSWAVCL
ncbi:hypothetical protein BJ170DRAFT_598785 [Xylariales sp. AK1849]|nr:hypothetical protein BJ170DRAFT_598785 [Xylariales sp. AK1849]